jgi:hypothetical protein
MLESCTENGSTNEPVRNDFRLRCNRHVKLQQQSVFTRQTWASLANRPLQQTNAPSIVVHS